MDKRSIKQIIAINSILAEWDPLGSQLQDFRYPFTEYGDYIFPIIETFESGKPLYDYLVELQLNLFGGLNPDIDIEIKNVTKKITDILK